MLDLRRIDEAYSVAPQIAVGDVAALPERGFAMVISNRPDGEEPGQPTAADIAGAAQEAGLAFRHIPVAGGFAQADVEAMARALAEAEGPVFAFCRSGTRSTLLWALARASTGGDPDAIAAAAVSAGYDIGPVRAVVAQLAATS